MNNNNSYVMCLCYDFYFLENVQKNNDNNLRNANYELLGVFFSNMNKST